MILDPALSRRLFEENEKYLFGVLYRLTGSAADADDLVQETFARAIEHPPARTDEPWRPWLVRVAVNLGRDHLRKRKRAPYVGSWLPSPLATERAVALDASPAARIDALESASFAFLKACEPLSAKARAVLVLRDVLDYSVAETAHALSLGESDVKVTLHRARKVLEGTETGIRRPTKAAEERSRAALDRFLAALATGDVAAIEACLAESVRATSDGGGEFHAAGQPILGRKRVAHTYLKLAEKGGPPVRFAIASVNGMPALVAEFEHDLPKSPKRLLIRIEADEAGRITRVDSVLATRKLAAI